MALNLLNKKEKETNYNPDFIRQIQPQGGFQLHENYVHKGDGYEATIFVYDTPQKVDEFWLYEVMNMTEHNHIVTMDIAKEDQADSIKNINQGIREQQSREDIDKSASSILDSTSSTMSLSSLYDDISKNGEAIMKVKIKIHVSARTAEALEKKVNETLYTLEGLNFKATVALNEAEDEIKSLFLPYDSQMNLLTKREGKEIPSLSLGASIPFSYSNLNDPAGAYLGTSFTGGNVIFDYFHKDDKRKFFNAVCVGTMGAGKSTTMKKLMLDNVIRGNFVRGFDIVGEFKELVNHFEGRYISLNGDSGIINPLQIQRAVDDKKKTQRQNEEQNYMNQFAKLRSFYKFTAPSADDSEVNEFAKLVRQLYEEKGITALKDAGESITTLPVEDYPILTDLLDLMRRELYQDLPNKIIKGNLSPARSNRLEKIELQIESLVTDFGNMFNGHSSIPSFFDEQIVFFKLRGIDKMPSNIFNAQMFNALNLLWENLLYVGAPQYEQMYDKNNPLETDDIRRYLLIIDEAHKVINTNNPLALDYVIGIAREARKYFGGLLFASQSFRDFVPENASSDEVEKIKTLFELTQYKFVMQQDANSLSSLSKIFDGQLSESEINTIPALETGECILSINGSKNVIFKVDASDEDLALFQGGQ